MFMLAQLYRSDVVIDVGSEGGVYMIFTVIAIILVISAIQSRYGCTAFRYQSAGAHME